MTEIKIERGIGFFSTTRQATRLLAVLFFIGFLTVPAARAAEQDTQLWVPVQIIHFYSDAWTVSMHTELRWQDNLDEFGDLVTGYQSKRNGDDLSAHVIQLGLSYNTRAKAAPLKPNVRDSFR